MKYTKEEIDSAWKNLEAYRKRPILAIVNSVSRSGMSRRIEFYSTDKAGSMERIGYYMARAIDWPYSIDKGGIMVGGCGMDMIFHTLTVFNYSACSHDFPDLSIEEKMKKFGRIYDQYFFDANNYQT
jgi:hypothetical protein